MIHILVVEDDRKLNQIICAYLSKIIIRHGDA